MIGFSRLHSDLQMAYAPGGRGGILSVSSEH